MLSRLAQFLKKHQLDIVLLIGVILISLLSFALGFITARRQGKVPLRIEREDIYKSTDFQVQSHNYNITPHIERGSGRPSGFPLEEKAKLGAEYQRQKVSGERESLSERLI